MGKSNKILTNIFSDYFSSSVKSHKDFFNVDNQLNITDQEIELIKEGYEKLIDSHFELLKMFGQVEKLIIQLRCREKVKQNVKLYYIKDYLYARAVFLKSNKIKDIRVPIGKQNALISPVVGVLQDDPEFMSKVIQKIEESMNKEINKTKEILFKLYNIEFTEKEKVEL